MTDGYIIKYNHLATHIIINEDGGDSLPLQCTNQFLPQSPGIYRWMMNWHLGVQSFSEIYHSPGWIFVIFHMFTHRQLCLWNCTQLPVFSDRVGPSGSGLACDGKQHAIPAKTPKPSSSTYQGAEYSQLISHPIDRQLTVKAWVIVTNLYLVRSWARIPIRQYKMTLRCL